MLTKSSFDALIWQNLLGKYPKLQLGYTVSSTGRLYENYYSNTAFNDFIHEMRIDYPLAYQAYAGGKGSELICHNGNPPKMASIASSSRFCYLALREGASVIGSNGSVSFECACPIDGIKGTPPQLDAHTSNNIYVEAKCHEIFDRHADTLRIAYWNKFFGENNLFDLPVQSPPESEIFEVPFRALGLESLPHRLDLKQFLCHLLGLPKNAVLVYLFFKPIVSDPIISEELNCIFDELTSEFKAIFNSPAIQCFCQERTIHIHAIAEHASIMEPLTNNNMITLATL